MNIGTIVFGGAAGNFSSPGVPRNLSVDFGNAEDRALIVEVMNTGSSAGAVTGVVIDPTGANIAMTAETQIGPGTTTGGSGQLRRFRAYGPNMPTGVKNVAISVAAGDSIINARAIPMGGVTSIAPGVTNASGGNSISVTVPSASGHVVLMSSVTMGVPDARVFTTVSPATLVKRVLVADHYFMHGIIVQQAGAASVSPSVTISAGTSTENSGWDLTLSATPDTTDPVMTGNVTVTPAETTATAVCPTATDNVGVVAYEASINGGTSWPFTSATTTISITGLTGGTTYSALFRAKDAAGRTSTPLAKSFTTNAPVVAATAITLSGPSSGQVAGASSNFTVGANGTITGSIVVTPSAGGGGGTFSPTSVTISAGSPTATFTYTPASSGAKTISVTNNGGLANPSSLTYTASATATAGRLLLNNNPADICLAVGSSAPLANKSATMWIHDVTSGALVASIPVTTDSAGLFGIVSSASMALNTLYRFDWKFTTGEFGVGFRTTEAS